MVKVLRSFLSSPLERYRDKRLVENDGSHLIEKYGARAVARALEFDAQGAAALTGRRARGHWARVARCISARPLPVRAKPVFG